MTPESGASKREMQRGSSLGRRHSTLAVSSSAQMLQPINEPADLKASGANGNVAVEGGVAAPPVAKRALLVRSTGARGSTGSVFARNSRIAAGVGNMGAHATKAAPNPEPTRYEEMMMRFQVRQLQRTPSVLTDASESRKMSVDASSARGVGEQMMMSERSTASPFKAFTRSIMPSRRNSTQSSQHDYPAAKYQLNSDRPEHAGRGATDRMSTSSAGYGNPGVSNVAVSEHPRWQDRIFNLLVYAASAGTAPISPFSTFCHLRYTALLAVTVMYLFYFPVELAFPASAATKTFTIAVSAFFGADALLALNTAFIDKSGALVTSRVQIIVHYMKHRFLIDIISSLPFDMMYGHRIASDGNDDTTSSPSWVYVMYAFRLERFVIVVRLVRLVWQLRVNGSANTIWAWVLYSRYSHLLRIAWIILLVLVIAHYIACIWALLAADAVSEADSWSENYAYSFYAALQLIQGQGIPTDSVAQDIFASFSILLGSLMLATVFGHVAILVSNFNATMTNYQRKMEGVFAVMTKMRLPPLLRERIHVYYEHLWNEYECLDGEIVQFTKELSHSLELEVVLFKYMEVVMHIPFFKDCTPDFQKQLLLNLQIRVYLPDDFIMRQGEVGDELFIVNRGYCELISAPDGFERVTGRMLGTNANDRQRRFGRRRSSSAISVGHDREMRSAFELDQEQMERVNATMSTLRQNIGPARQQAVIMRGQAFGDLALLMNYQCIANVRAITHVEMCVMSRKSFQTVLTRYPDDRKRVVLDMLTSYMDTCEKSKLPCPLLEAVRSVFVPSAVDSLSVAEAAAKVYRTIDADLRDTTIKYGIDDTTRERLVRLREQRRQDAQQKAATTPPVEPKPSPVSRGRSFSRSSSFTGRNGDDAKKEQQQQQQVPQSAPTAEDVVTANERQMIAARLKQIEERERTIQAALEELDASLTEMNAQRATELIKVQSMPCASCADRARRQTASVSTQTQDANHSPSQLRRSSSSRLVKKPRWARGKSQPQLKITNDEDDGTTIADRTPQAQAEDSPPRKIYVRSAVSPRGKGPGWYLARQRSQPVVVSSSNDPDLSVESADGAFKSPIVLLTMPLLQRMGTFVRLGPSNPTTIESPTRFADKLFNPKKTTEASSGGEVPSQYLGMGGGYKVRKTSEAKSSLAVAEASESTLETGKSTAAAHDPIPNRRVQFQRKHSRSLNSLTNADRSRTPAILKAMGSIVGLLDSAEAAPKPDESPTRYADELFQQAVAHPPRQLSYDATESPLAPVIEHHQSVPGRPQGQDEAR